MPVSDWHVQRQYYQDTKKGGRIHMDEATYMYRINSICLKKGEPFTPGRINVFVGANNCGKTQLLKDMLGYITGTRTPTIILNELEVPYPKTWDAIEQAYDMKIFESNQSKQLRHIAPTLDSDPSGPSAPDIITTLSHWLVHDKRAFRAATGAGLVTYLNTDNRLKLAMSQPVQQNLYKRGAKNVLEALYTSGSSATEIVRECIRKILGIDIFLNPFNLGTLEFKVGDDFSFVSNNPQEAFKQLSGYPILDTQGDGLRSVLGMISAIVSTKKPVLLLDEPEAFLHPPQALQLGEIISGLVEPSQQIFIATHSADFLRGLLSSTRDAVIIHLDRVENITEANVLDSATLNQIITDPLLSSSRVLEGMFYKGVVATEADADAVFYQRLFQKIGSADEVHFVNAHNKQTLKKIIDPYKKLGINFAMIADADVIRDKREFTDILQVTSDDRLKIQILEEREAIINYFQSQNKYEMLCKLRTKTKELVEQTTILETADPDDIASALFDFRQSLKKLRDESDELSEFKKSGRAALPDSLKNNFDTLWRCCANIGLFIVTVGELESWLIDYDLERSSNKSKWISKALNKLFEIEYDENKDIWKFINGLRAFLVS